VPQLEGKVVWVTGGGSGIGEAAALALSREGAAIVLKAFLTLTAFFAITGRVTQEGPQTTR
jgi:NAD(P)-dependent dehydrogenase (short-subunit alcohol dehydrogenase family)